MVHVDGNPEYKARFLPIFDTDSIQLHMFSRVFGHVCNYAFEKLVQRFVHIFCAKRRSVHECQDVTARALMNIDKENAIAESLQKELDREKQVDSDAVVVWDGGDRNEIL